MDPEAKKLTVKEKYSIIGWIFKRIHAINPHAIPLSLIQSILDVIVVYFPIIGLRYIMDAALAADWTRLLSTALIVLAGEGLLKMLQSELTYRNEMFAWVINEEIIIDLRTKAMTIDYHTATSPGQKERFRLALENMNFEMGNFGTFLRRTFNILQYFLSIATSLGLTLYLLLSVPQKTGGPAFVNWLVQPVPSVILTAVLVFTGFLLQFPLLHVAMKRTRNYLKKHAKAEADLEYYVVQLAGSMDRCDLFQNYDMLPMLRENLETSAKDIFDIYRSQSRANILQNMSGGIFAAVVTIAGYLLAALKGLYGAIPVASVLTYARAFYQMNTAVSEIMRRMVSFNYSLPYFGDIKEFYELDNQLDTGSIPVEKRRDHELVLELENVSFRYPGSDKDVLKNINLKLDMNRRHALVGPNGAGKTTLIYLLTRLYNPTEGRILLNGVDIKKYNYEEYLALFSVVFQDFKLFALPVGENVAAAVHYDTDSVLYNLGRAGFLTEAKRTLELLEQDVINMQTMEPQFSGGEMQKIAIARALEKDGSFVILDEPTAALDPKAEAEIYEHLQNLIENKTTVFISHRMSSCRLCEDIIVLDDGEMVEQGSHYELLEQRGLYHEMWEAQAQYYR